jgi:hypothetical protein
VDPELEPRQHLEQLLEGAEPAGQRHEAVGQRRHHGFPLVHARHHAEVAQPGVRDLGRVEAARNDAGDRAVPGEDSVRQDAHQPDRAAAVDEADSTAGEGAAEVAGGSGIGRVLPGRRAAEDADALHASTYSTVSNRCATSCGQLVPP